MATYQHWRDSPFARSFVLGIAAVVLAIGIFIIDTTTPLEGAVAVLYVVVVVIAANFFQRRGILLVALVCLALTVLSHLVMHGLHVGSALVRFLVSVAAIIITTALALRVREKENELQLTIDTIPILAWHTRPDGFAEYLNKRWLEYTGLSLEQARGWNWQVAIHPDDLPGLLEQWRDILASGKHAEAEARLRRFDGVFRWFLFRCEPLCDEQGKVVRWYGTNTDIEDIKRAEEALHETQAELAHVTRVTTLGELAASIAHDVSQPLTGIVTNGAAGLRWLKQQPPPMEEVRSSLESMIDDAKRASDVVQRIRVLSKKASLEKQQLDINDVVQDVSRLVQREVLSHGASIRLELAPALPPVLGDRVQLQQVIINLVINGIQAMDAITGRARELCIRSRPYEDGQVLVAVEDCGIGIDPEHMDRLFNAFFTTKSEGMGMGLSICRSIIEAHGGRIWASGHNGPGATFQFTLPQDRQAL